ncbi:MAG: hypothetical protein ACD_20C00095G0004 [uncultured bacterium]|nr:MAG: hypothetical protein ACD_20C00095G0004 [uncultured bacterium]HBH19260.1 hypothetical protein [Cyanobacteria bacterium UBA9579]
MSKNSKFLLVLGLGFIAVFLGSLTAFFIVFGQIAKNTDLSYITAGSFSRDFSTVNLPDSDIFTDIDSKINEIFKEVQSFSPKMNFQHNLNFSTTPTIKTENNSNEYKITVDLKSLGNDEKNVNLDIKDNRITISAKYENKKDDKILNSSSFYQSFSLSEKIDVSKVKKEKQGNNLIIAIPKTEYSQVNPEKAPIKNIDYDWAGKDFI